MIFTALFYVLGLFFNMILTLLPNWQLYPPEFLAGFGYFGQCMIKLNFLLPMYELCNAIILIINFEIAYYGIKILTMFINFVRGGKTIDI
jgi:hypothetical protein